MKKIRFVLVIIAAVFGLGISSCPITSPPSAPYDCDNPPTLAGLIMTKNAIRGQYLFGIAAASTGASAESVFDLSAIAGVTNVRKLTPRLFVGTVMDKKVLTALVRNPRVQYVYQDSRVTIKQEPAAAHPWGLDRIDQRYLPLDWKYDVGVDGAGVHFFIIDTGINGNAEFGDRLGESFYAAGFSSFRDGHGHGTHVAGTVVGKTYGVASGGMVHACKALGDDGSGATSQVVECIQTAVTVSREREWTSIINLSLGGSVSAILDSEICAALQSGVAVVVAAGNENGNACNGSPARVKQALTVGAIDKTDTRAEFSNDGACIDVWAPGVDIESIGGLMSGTSMASPHAAGVLGLFRQRHVEASASETVEGVIGLATEGVLSGVGDQNRLVYARED